MISEDRKRISLWSFVGAGLCLLGSVAWVVAQSTPGFVFGQVPTAGQWNAAFAAKQDVLGYAPVNRAGDTMTGKLTLSAGTTARAPFNVPQGSAPTTPQNGDVWTTSSGVFAQIAGVTVGPFGAGGGGGGSPGGSAGQIQYNNSGSFGGFTLGGDATFSVPNITVTKTGGVAFAPSATTDTTIAGNVSSGVFAPARLGASAASHAVPVDVAGVTTWKVVPNCTDTGGQHVNFTQATDAFSCGNTVGDLGTGTGTTTVGHGGTGRNSMAAGMPIFGNDTSPVQIGSVSGSGTLVMTGTGPFTDGHCPQFLTGNVIDSGAACGGTSVAASPPMGRLTPTSGTPVVTTDVASATTIFYTPAVGNIIPIYTGAVLTPTVFAELSNLTGNSAVGNAGPAAVVANSNYDLFVWNNSGTPTLTRGPVWTNSTTRSAGTALVLVNGVWLNNASITNGPAASRGTYVGTIRTNAAGTPGVDTKFGLVGTAGGSPGVFGIYNAYNQVQSVAYAFDTTASWTTTSNTPEPLDVGGTGGGLNNSVSFVQGLKDNAPLISWTTSLNTSTTAGHNCYAGFALDSTTGFTQQLFVRNQVAGSNAYGQPSAVALQPPQIGFHYIQAMQSSSAGLVCTFTGGGPTNQQLQFTMWNFLLERDLGGSNDNRPAFMAAAA